jgi:sulfotransferase
MKKFIFLGALPRSGSTLLCNILAQNPRFYVSKSTSGCHTTLLGIKNRWYEQVEHRAEGIEPERLSGVLNASLEAYHGTDKEVVIDKSRGWLSFIETYEHFRGEKPKIIAPVRNVEEVLASFEKLWRQTHVDKPWDFETNPNTVSQAVTLEGRLELWSDRANVVGSAYNRLKDALARGNSDCIHLVEFDDLTRSPKITLERIYAFIGEEPFHREFHAFSDVAGHFQGRKVSAIAIFRQREDVHALLAAVRRPETGIAQRFAHKRNGATETAIEDVIRLLNREVFAVLPKEDLLATCRCEMLGDVRIRQG